jgi:hypothetical protein
MEPIKKNRHLVRSGMMDYILHGAIVADLRKESIYTDGMFARGVWTILWPDGRGLKIIQRVTPAVDSVKQNMT